jgi:Mn2+/Fe2+ NRAMP family transporter
VKLQARHLIAAPFLAFSGYLLVEFIGGAPKLFSKSWDHIAFALLFTGILIFAVAVPGVLALKRRWEDFVKIVGLFVTIAVFALLSPHTSKLAKSVESMTGNKYRMLGAFWGMCVVASPFVICIAGYQRLVPLIVRRIYRST